jgi:hypothetical protein
MIATVALLAAVPLPAPDPLGFPAVPVLIQALAYLTLTLHLLAMNFTVGGTALLLVARLRRDEASIGFWATALPLGFSYLVTLGIPPLLFVQVLYGQMFYAASVLVGGFWILVIPLLITAYALLYTHKLTSETRAGLKTLGVAVALLAMLSVGYIYVNNLTLMLAPERWLGKYVAHPGGWTLNQQDPTHGPRYLFFILPAFAVAGLAFMLRGAYLARWGQVEEGRRSKNLGFASVVVGVIGVLAGAAGLLATFPPSIRAFVLGGGVPTALLAAAAAAGVLGLLLAVVARAAKGLLPVYAALLTFAAGLACVVVLRDQVRLAYLAPYFKLADVPIHVQYGMLAIFGGALVAGLALLIVLLVMGAKPLAARYVAGR